jgi:hypothetical protein
MNTLNRTPNEITKIFNDFVPTETNIRQMIRNYFSRQLMDTNEVDKMDVDIVVDVEDAMGLSSLELPNIIKMWQHPTEGWITFETYGGGEYDFDDWTTRELVQIMNDFDENYSSNVTLWHNSCI